MRPQPDVGETAIHPTSVQVPDPAASHPNYYNWYWPPPTGQMYPSTNPYSSFNPYSYPFPSPYNYPFPSFSSFYPPAQPSPLQFIPPDLSSFLSFYCQRYAGLFMSNSSAPLYSNPPRQQEDCCRCGSSSTSPSTCAPTPVHPPSTTPPSCSSTFSTTTPSVMAVEAYSPLSRWPMRKPGLDLFSRSVLDLPSGHKSRNGLPRGTALKSTDDLIERVIKQETNGRRSVNRNRLDGLLVVYKPPQLSSMEVCSQVKQVVTQGRIVVEAGLPSKTMAYGVVKKKNR